MRYCATLLVLLLSAGVWADGPKRVLLLGQRRDHPAGSHEYIFTPEAYPVEVLKHPITSGCDDFSLKDEFYYRLKRSPQGSVTPLLLTPIEGNPEMVAWAYQRPDGGRSFGFSGMHFHDNWKILACRRLVAQGLLWTLHLPIPAEGIPADVPEQDYLLPLDEPQKG